MKNFATHTSNYESLRKNWQLIPTFLFTILLAFTMISCDSSTEPEVNGGEEDPPPSQPAADEVFMEGNSFVPGNRTIDAGTTVTWTNTNSTAHTVTSGVDGDPDGDFDSGTLDPGDEYSYTFEEAGTYDYFCRFHWQAGMTGTITVENNNGNGENGENSEDGDNDDSNGDDDDDNGDDEGGNGDDDDDDY